MSTLYDEIVVIFVSEDQEATANIFERTPLLVRRGHILRALNWLKQHNPLYSNVAIDYDALNEYPIDGCVPFPVQHQASNGTIRSQSSTYTGHGIDTAEAIFVAQHDESDSSIPVTTTGTFDVDEAEISLNHRKISALRHLRSGGECVKTSTSSDTLSTRNNPQVYGMLWPTLFPYGVGMFEDPIRLQKVDGHGFKPVPLKTHVSRYLQLADRRFQTHLTFIFAMHNIQMMRVSSYMSRLAVRRAWWPRAMEAMEKIDDETLSKVESAMAIKKARKDYSRYDATTEAEKAIFQLLRYVDCVSQHIQGSTAEITDMREELRALARDSGTPSIFFTLNPADTYNPLASYLAGSDIDLEAQFNRPDSTFTPFHRARALAANPVAGAEFFKLMVDQFTDVFLGFERDCKRGVFGRVKHYYGVVEAQNRGSLHLHILIWLEGALSPLQIQQRAAADADFKTRLFRWLDTSFRHDLPTDTKEIAGTRLEQKQCLLGRPPHPDDPSFEETWPQFLREVLDVSGQVHKHNQTCFKHIPQSLRSLDDAERDKLCRFNYPAELVADTFMDDNGKIHPQRNSGNVVGHNPTISGYCQCNTDGKFVGSGAFGAALSVYMTNYTAKSSLDSAVVMSALSAAQKSLQAANQGAPFSIDEEQCRKLLLKTLNQMNGRRELSGQQVASALIGVPNHVTDARFAKVYWSKLLTWISPEHFPPYSKPSGPGTESDDLTTKEGEHAEDSDSDDEADRHDAVDLSDSLVLLNAGSTAPALNSLVYDVLYRPTELEHVPLWDQIGEYEKIRRTQKKQKKHSDVTSDSGSDSEHADKDTLDSIRSESELLFHSAHPQFITHALRRRKIRHIPVLCGWPIPRRDLADQADKYAVVILALFHPWNRSMETVLKPASVSWAEALPPVVSTLAPHYLKVINHMQEQWELGS